jgi:hypothetical protein
VIALVIHAVRKRSKHTLLIPSSPKSGVMLNSFRLRSEQEDYQCFINNCQDVQALKKSFPKTLQTSLKSDGLTSTTGLLNDLSTNSLNKSKPNEGYILFV